jgi:hypothetical protein
VYHRGRSRRIGGRPMQDKCESCGHEGLIQAKGGTIAFQVTSLDGPQGKVIRGFEFWQCPVCGLMVPPWDLVRRVASDPAVTNLDLDPPVYPDMSGRRGWRCSTRRIPTPWKRSEDGTCPWTSTKRLWKPCSRPWRGMESARRTRRWLGLAAFVRSGTCARPATRGSRIPSVRGPQLQRGLIRSPR